MASCTTCCSRKLQTNFIGFAVAATTKLLSFELCNLTVRCDRMENQIKEIQEVLKNKAGVNFAKNQFQEIEHKLVNEDADAALAKIDKFINYKTYSGADGDCMER